MADHGLGEDAAERLGEVRDLRLRRAPGSAASTAVARLLDREQPRSRRRRVGRAHSVIPASVGPGAERDRDRAPRQHARAGPSHRGPAARRAATSGAVRGRRSASPPGRSSAPSARSTMTSDVRVDRPVAAGHGAELDRPRRSRRARRRGAPAAPAPRVPSRTLLAERVERQLRRDRRRAPPPSPRSTRTPAISPSRTSQRSTDRADAHEEPADRARA